MNWNAKRVVVTGAAGFIGSHLVERLVELGAEVTALVRRESRGFLSPVAGSVRILEGDIRDARAVRAALDGAGAVFHLAALVGVPYSELRPVEVFEVNAGGTLNVLVAARDAGLERVVTMSTGEVYGNPRYFPVDESHPRQPRSPYAAAKIAADALALSFHAAYGLPVTVVRPFNTYGPRQSDRAIIPAIAAQALTRDEIRLGNLAPTRDFTFVSDVVEGLIRLAACGAASGQEVNLGSGREISVGELAAKIVAVTGRDVPVRQSDERVRPAAGEIGRLLADNSRARLLAGWEPLVSFEDGLRRTVEWVRARLELYDPATYRI